MALCPPHRLQEWKQESTVHGGLACEPRLGGITTPLPQGLCFPCFLILAWPPGFTAPDVQEPHLPPWQSFLVESCSPSKSFPELLWKTNNRPRAVCAESGQCESLCGESVKVRKVQEDGLSEPGHLAGSLACGSLLELGISCPLPPWDTACLHPCGLLHVHPRRALCTSWTFLPTLRLSTSPPPCLLPPHALH